MENREAKLEIAAKKLVKYFGMVNPCDYAEAVAEDGSTLEVCVALAKAGLGEEEAWIRIAAENAKDANVRLETVSAQRDRLRAALVGLVGVDGRVELEQMEAVMRLTPAPMEDKAVTIDAIHALLATVGEPPSADAVDPHADSTGKLTTRDKEI